MAKEIYRISFIGIDSCGYDYRSPMIYEFDNEQDALDKYDYIIKNYKPYNFRNIKLEKVQLIKKDEK